MPPDSGQAPFPLFDDDPDIQAARTALTEMQARLAASATQSGSPLFDHWHTAFAQDPTALKEMATVLAELAAQYNPSRRANRHIVGGVVEHVLAAALRSTGTSVRVQGDDQRGFDLIAEHALSGIASEQISVKSSFGPNGYKISNGLGGSGKAMTHPTIFLGPSLPGITYVTPDIHLTVIGALRDTGDGWTLPRKALLKHAKSYPHCVIPFGMPHNPGNPGGVDVAANIAHQLIHNLDAVRVLREHLD